MPAYNSPYVTPLAGTIIDTSAGGGNPTGNTGTGGSIGGSSGYLEPLLVAGELLFVLPNDEEDSEIVMQLVTEL